MNEVYINDYYIGLNDKDEAVQLLSTQECKRHIENVMDEYGVDAYTLIDCTGVYNGEPEATIILRIIGKGLCVKAIQDLQNILNQESILYTRQKVEAILC